METTYKEVKAKVYFFSPEEGGRSDPVDLTNRQWPRYEVLADFGLGYTKDGLKKLCMMQVMLDEPRFIGLGVEQTVRISLLCPEHPVRPGTKFTLTEGPKVVARATITAVLD